MKRLIKRISTLSVLSLILTVTVTATSPTIPLANSCCINIVLSDEDEDKIPPTINILIDDAPKDEC